MTDQNDPKFCFNPFGAKAILALHERYFGIWMSDQHSQGHFKE